MDTCRLPCALGVFSYYIGLFFPRLFPGCPVAHLDGDRPRHPCIVLLAEIQYLIFRAGVFWVANLATLLSRLPNPACVCYCFLYDVSIFPQSDS